MKKIAIVLLSLLFIAIVNFVCFDGARKAVAVFKSGTDTIEIEATITSSEKYTEIDEGIENDYWHAKVSYKYNGIEYSDVFYDRMEKPPTLGEGVLVKINPEVPNEVLPDYVEFILSLIISPVFLSITTIAIFVIMDFITNLLFKDKKKGGLFSQIIAALFVLSKLIIESVVFYNKHNSIVFAVFSLIAGCSLAVFVFLYSKKYTYLT